MTTDPQTNTLFPYMPQNLVFPFRGTLLLQTCPTYLMTHSLSLQFVAKISTYQWDLGKTCYYFLIKANHLHCPYHSFLALFFTVALITFDTLKINETISLVFCLWSITFLSFCWKLSSNKIKIFVCFFFSLQVLKERIMNW